MDIGIDLKEHKQQKTRRLGREDANSPNLKRINLALQGGGSHGAFAWGVLDRLLEDNCIDFDGISATSVGAVNATVLAYGLVVGGRAPDMRWRTFGAALPILFRSALCSQPCSIG
jgi:predicted acylesterase/phospholipase RssA